MAEGGNVSILLEDGSDAFFDHECTQCRAQDSKHEATDFCQDCKQFLCKICGRYHIRNLKTHTLVSVASLQQPQTAIYPVPNVTKCQYHPDRDIEMYCGAHDMVYCCRCIAKEHRSCSDVKEIEDVAHNSSLSTLQSLVANITRVSTYLHTTKLEMSNNLKLIQKLKASFVEEIKALRKQFNNHMDALEQKIIAELDEEQNKLEKEIGDDITAVDDLIIVSDRRKPDLMFHFDEKEIFITEKLGQVVLSDANNFLKKTHVFKHPTLKFEPNTILCDAIEKSNRIGKIHRIDTKNKRIQHGNYTVKLIYEINVRVSSDKNSCCLNAMCQLPDETILLIDCSNNKLKRLDEQLNVKDFIEFIAEPMGICSVSSTEVAVRLMNKTIHFMSVGKSLIYQRKISINDFKIAEDGMACCNNQLWIPGKDAIYIYSVAGTLVKKIGTNSQCRTMFPGKGSRHIAVSNDETLVYVARWADIVVLFNNNGNVIKDLCDQRLELTKGICVTEDNVVLVAGFGSKNVVLFDSDGNSQGELVSSKDMLYAPWSLCYDRKRCRLIAGYSSDTAQIFQLS